jgi:hypothetical protein
VHEFGVTQMPVGIFIPIPVESKSYG